MKAVKMAVFFDNSKVFVRKILHECCFFAILELSSGQGVIPDRRCLPLVVCLLLLFVVDFPCLRSVVSVGCRLD